MTRLQAALVAGVLLIGIGLGWKLRGPQVQIRTEYKDHIVEKVVEKEVVRWKTQVVTQTVTKYKDGTQVTETKTANNETVASEKKADTKDETKVEAVIATETQWSLGISYSALLPNFSKPNIELGHRLMGPVWITLGAAPFNEILSPTIGLRIEF